MKTTIFTAALTAASISLVHAAPSRRAIDDETILNFALTLEHLESAFYQGALATYDQAAFDAAGLPDWARGRFEQIAAHEEAHVKFLSAALGDKATKPCTYKFPYTDPASFAAVSRVLEGVGVSAYTGAAQFIVNKQYLTAAASVLSTEARHASWVAAAVNKGSGWSGALDIPLGINEVYTLAAGFITSCPPTNPALPVKAFPALSLKPNGATAKETTGYQVTYTAPSAAATDKPVYVAFYTGLSQIFMPVKDGKVETPKGLQGTVYAVVTTASEGTVSDESILAGPAILEFEFSSNGDAV